MDNQKAALNNLFADLHLQDVPAEERKKIIDSIVGNLQTRVGLRLADRLTDDQLKQFEAAMEKGDDAAQTELHKLIPNYPDIVAEEIAGIRQEIMEVSPQLFNKK